MRVPRHPPLPVMGTPPPPESPIESDDVALIRADLLIPGRGAPIADSLVAIKSGKIDYAGPASSCVRYAGLLSKATHVPVVMPGLWDCHVHYMGDDVTNGASDGAVKYTPGYNALVGAITVADLQRTLYAGYTSVRELEGYAGDLWPGIRDGWLVGPNIYSSVAALSITGGHADDHRSSLPTVLEAMNHGGAPLGICDGVDECVKAVRTMVRRGAKVIKVCSSGGVTSLNDDPEDRQFSDEELSAMVAEAGRSRRAVAAHAIGKAGIMAALRAGVKSIEHGMYLDTEAARLMVETGAVFVGTQHIQRILRDELDTLPAPIRKKLLAVMAHSEASYKTAIKEGVTIALGTDIGSSDPKSGLSHGKNGNEVVYAVEMGMTPLEAIECATANGPGTLGGMAPLSGQLREGYDADVIVLARSPLEDVSVLTDPANVTHVWKGGKLYKSPS